MFSSLYLTVMQMAWRERNPEARIKAAHDALEKNPELVDQQFCINYDLRVKVTHVWNMLTSDVFNP